MKQRKPLATRLMKLALMSIVSAVMTSQAAQATEELDLKYSDTIKSFKAGKDLKVRGLQLGTGIYLGHAKVAGKYGFGLVVDRKTYSWGINNRGVSILKRF